MISFALSHTRTLLASIATAIHAGNECVEAAVPEIDSSTAIRIALSDVPHSQRSVCGLALLADAVLVRRYSLISPSSCSVVTHSVAELEAAVGLVGVSLVQDLASPTSPSTPPTSETGFNYVETREVACTNANAKSQFTTKLATATHSTPTKRSLKPSVPSRPPTRRSPRHAHKPETTAILPQSAGFHSARGSIDRGRVIIVLSPTAAKRKIGALEGAPETMQGGEEASARSGKRQRRK